MSEGVCEWVCASECVCVNVQKVPRWGEVIHVENWQSSEGHPSHIPPTHGCPPVQQEWHSSCTAPLCGATQQGHWGGRIQYITYIKMAIMCSWHISYIHAYTQYHRNNLLVPNVLKGFLEVLKFLPVKHTANYKQTWHNLSVKLGLHFLHKVCGLTLVVSTTLPPWTTML